MKELSDDGSDLNEFGVNLHNFFKLSAKRIQDYFSAEVLTDLEPQRMIRHAETRWLGVQKVLLRIMEQLANIKQYFLKILPSDKKIFNGKMVDHSIGKSFPSEPLVFWIMLSGDGDDSQRSRLNVT